MKRLSGEKVIAILKRWLLSSPPSDRERGSALTTAFFGGRRPRFGIRLRGDVAGYYYFIKKVEPFHNRKRGPLEYSGESKIENT